MDDIHREFMILLGRLDGASGNSLMPALDALFAHTVAHFEQENVWMEATGFPPMHCHRGEHERVLEVLHEVRKLAAAGDDGIVRTLVRELPLWFEHHVATMDAMLAQHIASCAYPAQTTLPALAAA